MPSVSFHVFWLSAVQIPNGIDMMTDMITAVPPNISVMGRRPMKVLNTSSFVT